MHCIGLDWVHKESAHQPFQLLVGLDKWTSTNKCLLEGLTRNPTHPTIHPLHSMLTIIPAPLGGWNCVFSICLPLLYKFSTQHPTLETLTQKKTIPTSFGDQITDQFQKTTFKLEFKSGGHILPQETLPTELQLLFAI